MMTLKERRRTDAQAALARALDRREKLLAAMTRNEAKVKELRQQLRRYERAEPATPAEPAKLKAGLLADRILAEGIDQVFPNLEAI